MMSNKKRIINPITAKDVKVTLRGHSIPVTVLAVNVLLFLAGLLGVYGRARGMEIDGRADYRQFLYVYAVVCFLLEFIVLLAGCIITSGSITGEKESGTFDLLKSAGLSATRIAAGKLLSAVHAVAVLIVSAFPALLVPLMFGGPGLTEVFCVVAGLFPLMLFSACTGLFVSSLSRSSVVSAAVSAAAVIVFAALPALLTVFLLPKGTAAGTWLVALDPLTPVVSLVLSQIGEGARLSAYAVPASPADAAAEWVALNLTAVSFGLQVMISLLLFALTVRKIGKA